MLFVVGHFAWRKLHCIFSRRLSHCCSLCRIEASVDDSSDVASRFYRGCHGQQLSARVLHAHSVSFSSPRHQLHRISLRPIHSLIESFFFFFLRWVSFIYAFLRRTRFYLLLCAKSCSSHVFFFEITNIDHQRLLVFCCFEWAECVDHLGVGSWHKRIS